MARVDITQDFSLPVERVFAYLAEHENLGSLFGATVTRLKDGDTERNGAGSVRRLKLGPLPAFEETVTHAVTGQVIEYRITKGSPLRGHSGRMDFAPLGSGTRLHCVIEFGTVVPGFDQVVAVLLNRNVRKGLKKVDAKA